MSNGSLGPGRYLLDTSVWVRAADPVIAPIFSAGLRADQLVACGPFVIEALYSSANSTELAALLEELTEGMAYLDADSKTWSRAFAAQVEMAQVAPQFHRRPAVDYLIAALADREGVGVLHYDRDYDLIAEHSGLRFESRWVAPRGTLQEAGDDPLRPYRRGITARLAQFTQPQDRPVFERVIALLDGELSAADKQPLRPVSETW